MQRRLSALAVTAACLAFAGSTALAHGSRGGFGGRGGGFGVGVGAHHGGYSGGYHGGYGGWRGGGWAGPRIGLGVGIGLGAGAAYGYYGQPYYGYPYRGYWRPRVGVYVSALPIGYSTWYYGGAPYYYSDGAYYAPGSNGGYTVVDAPPAGDLVAGTPGAALPQKALPDPVIYPRNSQSAEQTERDRQDCDRWAASQPSAVADASVFQRATAACLDARGYTVR